MPTAVDIQVLDAGTTHALDIPPAGALLTRLDGRELRRWTSIDAVPAGEWPALPEIPRAQTPPGPISTGRSRG